MVHQAYLEGRLHVRVPVGEETNPIAHGAVAALDTIGPAGQPDLVPQQGRVEELRGDSRAAVGEIHGSSGIYTQVHQNVNPLRFRTILIGHVFMHRCVRYSVGAYIYIFLCIVKFYGRIIIL